MTTKPRIAVIIGSTRATRFADKPAAWIFELASQRNDWEVELVDLRDFDLPFFNERTSNLWAPSEDPTRSPGSRSSRPSTASSSSPPSTTARCPAR